MATPMRIGILVCDAVLLAVIGLWLAANGLGYAALVPWNTGLIVGALVIGGLVGLIICSRHRPRLFLLLSIMIAALAAAAILAMLQYRP